MLRKPANKVVFADEKFEQEFNFLLEDDWLKKAIQKVINNLKENVFSGRNIPKRLIPKAYVLKQGIDNLFWYQLPNAWRLVYSILTPNKNQILAVIIEYFDHKNYEKRFKYQDFVNCEVG